MSSGERPDGAPRHPSGARRPRPVPPHGPISGTGKGRDTATATDTRHDERGTGSNR